jgi:hypothetical protein
MDEENDIEKLSTVKADFSRVMEQFNEHLRSDHIPSHEVEVSFPILHIDDFILF